MFQLRGIEHTSVSFEHRDIPTVEAHGFKDLRIQGLQRIPESWNMGLGGFVLGSLFTLRA